MLGPTAVLLPYPGDNILGDGFTDDDLCVDADVWHGNKKYGAIVLRQVLDHLR
jgi:hypothetical protein